ncbi:hypothetical protein [Spiroplasma sp. AdecLV25b]|uniref:hypothetical protein n=1 Tax=Spiroplasma sp. AdecLV25b TaxID=3027162 RepID=UPI0027E0C987|nr:hypothetical protein [Spiroplasma sp. AdecLV25b]
MLIEKDKSKKKIDTFLNKYMIPILQKLAGNMYLRSLMEGFYVTLPIIVFSSLVGIIMWIPPAFAGNTNLFPLELRMFLNRLYIFTMGLVSIWFVFGYGSKVKSKITS